MAEDKQQTLSNLYSLRAGISAVANEREEVEKINKKTDNDIKEINNRICELENKEKNGILDKINKLNEEKNNLQSQIYTLNREIKEKQDYVDKNKNIGEPAKNSCFDTLFSAFPILIVPVVAVAFILLYIFVIDPHVESSVINLIFYIIMLIGGFFGVCCLIAFFYILFYKVPKEIIKNKKTYKKRVNDYYIIKKNIYKLLTVIKEKQDDVSDLQKKLSCKDNSIAEVENEMEVLTKKIEDYQNKISQLETSAEKACILHYQLGGVIQQQFENQFNSFLNLRDWANVDIIIFAYESGRVETMKEALTYADQETRTDRIVKTINDSSQAVCRSIQSGLRDLAYGMGECFSVISQQIAEQTNRLDKISINTANLATSIAENTAKSTENLANLASKVDYANALQEQRNVSSAKLVEENSTFMLEARNYMHDLYNDKY